jgi:hypothetical protein
MECMSTMLMKLKHQERQKDPLPDAPNVKVVLRHLHRHRY